MEKKETRNEAFDLGMPDKPGLEDLEEAFRILRSLPDGPGRDVTVANVVDIARGALQRAQEQQR